MKATFSQIKDMVMVYFTGNYNRTSENIKDVAKQLANIFGYELSHDEIVEIMDTINNMA